MQKDTIWYGLFLCIGLAITAVILGIQLKLSSVTLVILLGLVVRNTCKLPRAFSKGIGFSEKKLLAWAIGLMGVNFDFKLLSQLGWQVLLLIVMGIGFTLFLAVLLAKFLQVDRDLAFLTGMGNAVCGNSAIAATQGIIQAREEKVGISIAVITILGTVGMFALPLLGGNLLKLPELEQGILMGNTLQAVGQVSAAGFSVGELAGQTATVVKMGRILMLTPLLLLISSFRKNSEETDSVSKTVGAAKTPVLTHLFSRIPLCIPAFMLTALVATAGILPHELIELLSWSSKQLLLLAMAGIGLKITFNSLYREGGQTLVLGAFVHIGQILFSLLFIQVVM